MGTSAAVVAIASSDDVELGERRAPLDAELGPEQVEAVVRRALDLDDSAGALRRIVGPDDWVVLKPNIVTSPSHACSYFHGGTPHPGQCTDLRVIRSLIAYLIDVCRPRRITIAEGGAEWVRATQPGAEDGWTVHWPEFGGLSYVGLVEEFGAAYPGVVDIVDLNEDDIRYLPVPDPHGSGVGAMLRVGEQARSPERYGRNAFVGGTGELRQGYHIPATVLDCDCLISVPAMKTHTCATTLALKNYVGILPNHPSGVVLKREVHDGDLQKGFIDLFSYHPADYSVIEGFWSTEGNGPQWGDDLRHNVVVASADPVAADAVTSALMGFNPDDIDYLHYAARKGFGTMDLERIQVVGGPLRRVYRKFATAAGRKGVPFTARGNRSWLVRSAPDDPWQPLESEERYIDLARFWDGTPPQQTEAVAEVVSGRPQRGRLWASASGPFSVILGGVLVATRDEDAEHSLGEVQVDVELPAGPSSLVVRVGRGAAGTGFTALLCDEDGYGLRDIEYRVGHPAEHQPEKASQ